MAAEVLGQNPYGVIASTNKIVRLVDICIEKDGIQTGPFGSQLHSADYVPEGTPIIMVEHLGENVINSESTPFVSDSDIKRLARYTMKEGDIVFSRVGYVDKRALVKKENDGWLFSGSLLRVRPDVSLVDPTYLSYFFGFPRLKKHMGDLSVGTTRPSINTTILKNVPVILPTMAEQKFIGNVLSNLDAKIAINIKVSKTLEEITKLLFRSWFVEFEPVKRKIAGENISGADLETASLFPDELESSEWGAIPVGWEFKPVGEVFTVSGGTTPSTARPEYWGGEFYWTTPKDLSSQVGIITTSSARSLTLEGLNQISSGLLPEHSVLMSSRAPIGYLSINAVPTAVNQGFITIRKSEDFSPLFILNWISSKKTEILSRAGGATFAEISRRAFSEIPFLLPNREVVNAFSDIANPILSQLEALTRENEALISIRESLLPRLISGELQIPEEMLAS